MTLRTCGLIAVMVATASFPASAATIVDYNLTGLTAAAPPDTVAATTVAAGVSADLLSRGPGILPNGLTNGYSSNSWTLGSSEALAIANGDFYQWGFDVDATHTVSVSNFDTNLRRSAIAAPSNFLLYVSLDDFATAGTLAASFMYLGRSSGTAGSPTPYQWMTTDTPGQGDGNPISTQDLSGVALLQNIAPGSSVTFRLYAWGDTAGAADTNTVALGRVQGPLLSGTITEIPEPASLILCFTLTVLGMSTYRGRL